MVIKESLIDFVGELDLTNMAVTHQRVITKKSPLTFSTGEEIFMKRLKPSFASASLLGIILAGHVCSVSAADRTVCPLGCDFTTVQAAITAAVSGDTVLVGTEGRAGVETYPATNIQMKDGVTLKSEGNNDFSTYTDTLGGTGYTSGDVLERATLTILQGDGNSPVVTFSSVTDTSLDGFIIEGVASNAPEHTPLVKIYNSSPTVQYNIIRNNQGPMHNGGIMVGGGTTPATPNIQYNVIHYVNGAGICINSQGVPTIYCNEIFTTPPTVQGNSPGIGLRDDSAATILDNIIFKNEGPGIGSGEYGIFDSGFPIVIKGNTIYSNTSGTDVEPVFPFPDDGPGIAIKGQKGSPTSNVNIIIGGPDAEDRNTIYDCLTGITIEIDDSNPQRMGTAVIENNDIHQNSRPNIFANNLLSLTIKGNDLQRGRTSIRTNKIDNLVIQRNIMAWNGVAGGMRLDNTTGMESLLIDNNDIHNNERGGLYIKDRKTIDNATISNNRIYNNVLGGIMFYDSASHFDIVDNEIHHNSRGGIHTGKEMYLNQGYGGIPGELNLTIRGNKIYKNGSAGYGGGIDVRHASGTIENNLVYQNERGGIRFGEYITSITHNTVTSNGMWIPKPEDDTFMRGGGIIYSDLTGELNGPPSGYLEAPIIIKNNITYDNYNAGIMTGAINGGPCDIWEGFRDYNLVSKNMGWPETEAEIGWMLPWAWIQNLGGCYPPSSGEIYAAPEFVDYLGDDFHLQPTSAAVDAGDPTFPYDVAIPSGTPPNDGTVSDMGAHGGPNAINW